jgi:hypothetical protein
MTDPMTFKRYTSTFNGKALFTDFNKLTDVILTMTDAELNALQNDWDNTEEYNKGVSLNNFLAKKELKAEVDALFKKLDIPTVKTSTHGKVVGEYAEYKAMNKAIDAKCKTYDGIGKPCNYVLKMDGDVHTLHDPSNRSLVALAAYGRSIRQRKVDHELRMKAEFALAATLAGKYGIALDDPDMFNKVVEADEKAWIATNYPNGTEMDHSCCDDCDSWTVGEHRCHCGNRRLYLEVEGSLGNWWAKVCAD